MAAIFAVLVFGHSLARFRLSLSRLCRADCAITSVSPAGVNP
jgi:hypothetical protein